MAKTKPPVPPASKAFVEVGDAAPELAAMDQAGKTHSVKEYRGKWVVLYFYPKDDTPGCTTEACGFRDGHKAFAKANAVVLGVSPDDEKAHKKFADKFSLPFPLLADAEKRIIQAYGVWREKSMYGRKYMGVERTTYLIDPKGKVAHRWEKVKVTDHDAEVLKKIAELS
ncbi:MAG: thioredoxin-dependent thiol peroxidase [Planctomycetes bacterium]|nr:thioredoxin-dependent thiol peroxidase [Planctomycetota bacterium]